MSAEIDRLTASVANMTTVVGSAVAAFEGLAAQVRAAAGDRAASLVLADNIDGSATTLADAVVAHTPAA